MPVVEANKGFLLNNNFTRVNIYWNIIAMKDTATNSFLPIGIVSRDGYF
jgi:hypothetical protein